MLPLNKKSKENKLPTASIARVPHPHAEVIKAWADDPSLTIQFLRDDGEWEPVHPALNPSWHEDHQYRVKPAKVYPVTGMTAQDCKNIFNDAPSNERGDDWQAIANAALRHAIDANTIITMADHQTAINLFGERLRDVAIEREKGRDMAIAEAVRSVWERAARDMKSKHDVYLSSQVLDLAAIIAKVAQ